MVINFIFLFSFIKTINSFMFHITQYYSQYCFSKQLKEDNQKISYNYVTIGEKKEFINITLKQVAPYKKEIHSTSFLEANEYISPNLNKGKYILCFISNSKNEYKISFNFQTTEEDGNIKNIATDEQLKKLREKMENIKTGMNNLENNANNYMNIQYTHFMYLNNHLKQIKNLTFTKVIVIGFIVLFQIYVIQKMLGDDKRVSKIKTNDSNGSNVNNQIEFL